MEHDIINLAGEKVGVVSLSEQIFGVSIREDLIARTVVYQLAKRRAGTHKVKNRGEIARTGAKIYRQKGSGRARHGSARVNLFRGGGRSFGPHPRDHSISLQKKVRRKALCAALSQKVASGKLLIMDEFALENAKTKLLASSLQKLGVNNGFFIDGSNLNEGFRKAVGNLPNRQVVASMGANVLDIVKSDWLVVSKSGIESLEARLASS